MQEENTQALSCQQFELITESNIKINGLSNINELLSTHYLIYRIDNLKNGKHYIGQHQTQNPLDDYMGSGKLIKRAILKHGRWSFVKTILFDFANFDEMNEKEKELVPLSACYPYDPMSYNILEGGANQRSFKGPANGMYGKNPLEKKSVEERKEIFGKRSKRNREKPKDVLVRESKNRSEASKKCWKCESYRNNVIIGLEKSWTLERRQEQQMLMTGNKNPMYGESIKDHMTKEEWKNWHAKIKKHNQGISNPAYGRKWIYNPILNRRKYVKAEELENYLRNGWILGQNFKANAGKKRMYLPNSEMKSCLVDKKDISKFLKRGYKFGINPKFKKQ